MRNRFFSFWVEFDLDVLFFVRFTSIFGNVYDAFKFVLYRFIFYKVYLRIVMNPYVFEFSKPPWRKFSRVQDYVLLLKLMARSGHTVVYWSWQLRLLADEASGDDLCLVPLLVFQKRCQIFTVYTESFEQTCINFIHLNYITTSFVCRVGASYLTECSLSFFFVPVTCNCCKLTKIYL